jgi:alcohol dehydrogenase (cytochrome c)
VAQGFSPASAALQGCATLCFAAAVIAVGGAQSFEKRPADSWPTYHGDYSGQRHSPLTQITPANVSQMTLAWAFQTGQSASIKSTPIVVNGMLYVSAPDQLWAIDARTARQVWQYRYPDNTGFHIGHRGVAVHKDACLPHDARRASGRARRSKWKSEMERRDRGREERLLVTNAPLLIRNHLLVGVAGDFDNLPGILTSVDPDTGKTQWVYYSTPPPGTPGLDQRRGATGRSDVDDRHLRSGARSRVRRHRQSDASAERRRAPRRQHLDQQHRRAPSETGKMEWGFQTTPHDTHDWDASEVPVLVEGMFDGVQRKMILQAARNGYSSCSIAANGTNLKTIPFRRRELGHGRRQSRAPDSEPRQGTVARRTARRAERGRRHELSFAQLRSRHRPVHRQRAGQLRESTSSSRSTGTTAGRGADYNVYGRGVLRAIDYRTGAVRWSHELGDGAAPAGVLTTASGLVFTGDNSGNALALRTSDGATLWHASIGTVGNAPISYELDGRQYVVMGGGGVLFGFTLPR